MSARREYKATPTEDVTKLPKLVQHTIKAIDVEHCWTRHAQTTWYKVKSFTTVKEAQDWVDLMNAKAQRRAHSLNPKAEPFNEYRISAKSLESEAANEP